MIKKYWKLGSLLSLILISESLLTGLLPVTSGQLFGYLNTKEILIWSALWFYFLNHIALDFFQAIKLYFVMKLSLRLRKDRTKKVLISRQKKDISNIPQRIQEDIKLSYINRITVWCEYFISGTILIQLLIMNLDAPILIIAALVYAGISVVIAMKFNPKLTLVEKEVQATEASFRDCIKDKNVLNSLTSLSYANTESLRAAKVRMHYLLFTKLQLGLVTILPFLVLVPSLLNGTIDLGTLMKHQATFSLIVVNAAILIAYYTTLIQGKASEERVRELE